MLSTLLEVSFCMLTQSRVLLLVIGGLGIPKLESGTGWGTGAVILILTFAVRINHPSQTFR